jgi:hypothetical protein
MTYEQVVEKLGYGIAAAKGQVHKVLRILDPTPVGMTESG